MKILFTGGGTGGHLMPLIAVGRELRRLYQKDDLKLYYIGPKDAAWILMLRQEGFKTKAIASGKIRNYFSLQNIIDVIFFIPIGCLQSFLYLLFIRPQLVFSKGGTGSLAVTLCARLLFIPVFIHESDVVPGRSNQIAGKWAKKIFTSFEKTEYFDLSKTQTVGTPIKKELLEGDINLAKETFGLTLQKPVLLFLGGSQGAKPINDFLLVILNDLLQHYEVIHACGLKNFGTVQSESTQILAKDLEQFYHLYPSLDEVQLKHAYQASSLIISRSGSASIFEIAALGKPSILIPLPTAAGDHQSKNAYQYAHTGAAVIIEQDNLTHNFFIGKINFLLSQPKELEAMKQAALQFAKPLAARAIAREIIEFLQP